MRIMIAVPCMDQVSAHFAWSLATLKKVEECQLAFEIGSLIYSSRNELAKKCIRANADALLFLDSDMIFPDDTIEKMVKHLQDGKEIVTGLYFRRRAPFTPVLFEELAFDQATGEGHSKDLTELPDTKEPFEVAGAGMGCCIIHKNVLLDVMLNYQTWFNPLDNFGEDLAFDLRARELGHKIWCDPTISCGHIGQLIINEEIWRTNFSGKE